MKKDLRWVKEPCGHTGMYDFFTLIPFHRPDYRIEIVQPKNKYIKRTFCDICATYWDVEYKKLK